jgi:hypothetical protein
MTDTTYNGWTNYATWRVNLEIFDGIDLMDYGWQKLDEYDLAQELEEYTMEIIDMGTPESLAKSYALAFLSDVNWREIAQHMICDWADDERDEDEETATN